LRQEPGDGSTPVSILMLDIDHFKSINDQFGHDVGDKVIVNVSGSIRKSVRSVDIPGRWGCEEFIVLCMSDLEGAVSNAEKLGNIIAEQDNSPVGQVTVSIGVTSLLSQDTVDSLLTRVDKALYQAKNSGRNQIIIRNK
jgi:diguanylate cyclase (GGDEF)-like protein